MDLDARRWRAPTGQTGSDGVAIAGT